MISPLLTTPGNLVIGERAVSPDLTYNYHALSPRDFEQFAEGPDDGIDMRCCVEGGLIIGQAKRYQRFADLHHAGKAECDKLAKLKPQRYVLMTSCPLTTANKARVVEALAPFCRDAGDIWGRDELDATLARHPQVLRRHVGLWLQDEAQLQLVLHNGVIAHLTSVHPRYDTRILLKECRALLSELRVMWPDEDVHWLYRLIDSVAGGESCPDTGPVA